MAVGLKQETTRGPPLLKSNVLSTHPSTKTSSMHRLCGSIKITPYSILCFHNSYHSCERALSSSKHVNLGHLLKKLMLSQRLWVVISCLSKHPMWSFFMGEQSLNQDNHYLEQGIHKKMCKVSRYHLYLISYFISSALLIFML